MSAEDPRAGEGRRVLRVVTRLNIGGPARHALILARGLPELGWPSTLAWGRESRGEGLIPPDGIDAVRIESLKRPLSPSADVRAYRALVALIRSKNPSIVHTHMAKAGALGRLAALRARTPVTIHTFHGHVLDEYFSRPVAGAFAATERALAKRTDALVAVSVAVRDSLLARGIGKPEQWHVIPLGLELNGLLAGPKPRAEARTALGLPPDAPIVGIVGRIAPIKAHDTFLEIAARVASKDPDVHFVVAGDGELRSQIEERARRTLGDRVHFLGWVTDLGALYGALDVVVLTSRNEGTPVALIEAAAAGKPVVATEVGGVADVVVDGSTGFLARAGDASAIADRVLDLLAQPERATAMGHAGRIHVRDRFTARRLVDDVAELYGELLGLSRTSSM